LIPHIFSGKRDVTAPQGRAFGISSVAAARERLSGEIPQIDERVVEDARWYALGANTVHGLRRTNEDKRRAVEGALAMRPGMSSAAIAEHCGVSHTMVNGMRPPLEDSSSQPAARTGRDGRTIDTSNIGKRREEPDDAEQAKERQRAGQERGRMTQKGMVANLPPSDADTGKEQVVANLPHPIPDQGKARDQAAAHVNLAPAWMIDVVATVPALSNCLAARPAASAS
jgi:hypothetical protein